MIGALPLVALVSSSLPGKEGAVRQFRFRALVTLESWAPARGRDPRGLDPSATHALMIHAWHADQPSRTRSFPAAIARDDGRPLGSGEHQVVTITIADDEAPLFLAPGRRFTIWGGGSGRGVISRQVFTDSGPS
jgi:hypothetical protein